MQLYNHTRSLFVGGEVAITSLNVMLVGSGYTFNATEADMTTATAQEVSGNGWPQGGPDLMNANVTIVNISDGKLDADDVDITATGGDIGPASGLVVYDSTDSNPLFYYEFPAEKTADEGTQFVIRWDDLGIYEVSEPA